MTTSLLMFHYTRTAMTTSLNVPLH